MTIHYINTRSDLFLLYFRILVRSRMLLVLWAVFMGLDGFTAFRDAGIPNQNLAQQITAAFWAVSMTGVFVIGLPTAVVICMAFLRKNKGTLCEHRLSISEAGLTESTEYNESLNRWSGYHKTVITKNYIFLYVSEGLCHIVPKKRPLLGGDLKEFEAALVGMTHGK
ncbi:MAG: YcxB family protein [Luteolibacter sp.]